MFKSKVLWVALGAALLLSLAFGGAVMAQGRFGNQAAEGECDMSALSGQMMRRGAIGGGMMGGNTAGGATSGGMMGGYAFGAMAEWHETTLVSVAAQQLNLTEEQVIAELGEDKTLEQVILAHNGNPQAVVDSYVAARKVILDKLVADGRMTQAQEDQMLARVAEEAAEHLKTVGACNGDCDGDCAGAGSGQQQLSRGGRGGGMMGGRMGQGSSNGGRGRMAPATGS